MPIYTLNGVVYDTDLWPSADSRGYAIKTTPGIGGDKVENFAAFMLDAAADAAKQMVTTSGTSVTVGTGSKGPFTLAAPIPYALSSWVQVASAGDSSKFMLGQVTAISGTSLTINVPGTDYFGGSGSATDWTVSSSGLIGPTGPTGGGLANVVDDTTPQLGGQLDNNGFSIGDGTLEILSFAETPSAVNEFTMTNAATGNAPDLSATGDDANIDISITPKGTGVLTSTKIRTWTKGIFIGGALSDQDYDCMLDLPAGFDIVNVRTQSKTGTCTATFKIGVSGGSLTALGGTANSVSTTSTTQAHSSANTTVAGDDVVVTISANSACEDMIAWFEIEGEL
jgi:hypothetical protein